MPPASDDIYSVLLADLTETERERVRSYADKFGIEPTDAVWSLMIVLGHYSNLYEAVPEKINVTVQGILEKIRSAAAAEAESSRVRLQASLTDAVVGAAESVAARKGLSELLKWSSIATAAGVLLLAGIFSLGYWLGFDHGRARGFNAGVEGHLAASWALSVDGLQAYELWKGGDLEHLTACDRPGWKLESGVCFPRADEGKIYGWHVR
jgi:ElaB/YqjD/DUF883 family membrane-anchored ribosome-binding protein